MKKKFRIITTRHFFPDDIGAYYDHLVRGGVPQKVIDELRDTGRAVFETMDAITTYEWLEENER